MSSSPAPVVAKESWLKRFGHVVAKILGIAAKDAPAIAALAAPVAEALLPQFASEINFSQDLIGKIAKQAVVTEALVASTGAASSGKDKFEAVLANIGPEIDQWVANAFPGVKQVSSLAKSNLVQAVVAILNEEVSAVK